MSATATPSPAEAVQHCCERMREAVAFSCPDHPDRHDCPDALLEFWPSSTEYGLLIHDGGASMQVIDFCPFCGARLPQSTRPW